MHAEKNIYSFRQKIAKSQKNFVEKLRPYYFLFICRATFATDMVEIFEDWVRPTVITKK